MAWTKIQFIEAAFTEIGMASYVYDADPEDLQAAMMRLDAMMAEWHKRGIQIGWPVATDPKTADLDTDTLAPWSANSAIYLNLALRISPSIGKEPSAQTRIDAKMAFNTLQGQFTKPRLKRMRGLPSGAGNRRFGSGSSRANGYDPLPDTGADLISEPNKTIGFDNG